MLSLQKPDQQRIDSWLAQQAQVDLNYPEIGATRGEALPGGYMVDRNAVQLGQGMDAYQRAVDALRGLHMWDFPWIELVALKSELEVGTVLTLTRQWGIWFLNPCRIVYVIDEDQPTQRIGFAYGTLAGHVEQGEERFSVERRADDTVWYEILAFSRPVHLLAMLAYPYTRRLQRRFGRDSLQAMVKAVSL